MNDFYFSVFEVVKKIPYGRVTTYGDIAEYLGTKSAARLVGYALNVSHGLSRSIPAHRVVNRVGMLSGKFHFETPSLMQQLLESEGIIVKENLILNFDTIRWIPSKEL